MGQEYAQQIVKSMGVYRDQKVQDYVSGLGKALAAEVRATQPAVGLLRDGRSDGQRVRASGRFHLRHPRHHDPHEQRGRAGRGAGPRDRPRDRPALGPADVPAAARADRPRGRKHPLVRPSRKYAGLASQGLGVLFLKYGRDAESQSDQLGFKYMVRGRLRPARHGHDVPDARAGERAGGRGGHSGVDLDPPESRQPGRGNARRASTPSQSRCHSFKRDREKYLPVIAGMTYGEDPKQGFIEGNTFYHPELRFKLDLPAGWQSQNTPQALAAVSPKQDALLQLTAPGKGSPEEAARQFFGQEGIKSGRPSNAPINGLPAAARLLRGADGTGGGAGPGRIHPVRRSHLPFPRVHAGGPARGQ